MKSKLRRFLPVLVTAVSSLLVVYGCIQIPAEQTTIRRRKNLESVIRESGRQPVQLPGTPLRLSTERSVLDSAGFNLLTWNIQKGQRTGWKADFERLVRGQDLLVLQEAYLTEDMRTLLDSAHHYWDMNAAFRLNDIDAGVLTASRVEPSYSFALRHPEPILQLPKTMIVSLYPMSDTRSFLLVANLHSINFSLDTRGFSEQFDRLEKLLSGHDGPMIVTGDFNTWSRERSVIVEDLSRRLNLESVPFQKGSRSEFFGRPVDHILYRGLLPIDTSVERIASSDHNPLFVRFRRIVG